jgi:hypothetical protein
MLSLSRCASCLTAHFLAPSAALFASATQGVSVAVSRVLHGRFEAWRFEMRHEKLTSSLLSAHDLCYVLLGARKFGTGLLQSVISQHSYSQSFSDTHTVFLPFCSSSQRVIFGGGITIDMIAVRGARNGDKHTFPACSLRFFSRALSRWLPRAILLSLC